eukprot:2604072-Pyramimonas_sp.AAC.1
MKSFADAPMGALLASIPAPARQLQALYGNVAACVRACVQPYAICGGIARSGNHASVQALFAVSQGAGAG